MLLRFVALASLLALAAPAHAEQCPGGKSGSLALLVQVPRIPTLQGGIGHTLMTQRFADPAKSPVVQQWPGIWSCFGYLSESNEFVLLHRDVMGATPAYVGLTFRHEVTGAQRALQWDGLGHVVLPAPGGRYAAAVVGTGTLLALDLQTGTVRALGPAPAPPPLSAEEARFYKSRKPLSWDRDPRSGTADLEPEVLRFTSPTQLQATFGADGALRRATKRRTQLFDLAQLPPPVFVGKQAPVAPRLSK